MARVRNQQCSCCKHREVTAINLGLSRGVSVTALSRRFKVSTDSLYRHSRAHLPPQLRAALIAGPSVENLDIDRLRSQESQSLLSHLIAARNRLFHALDCAETYNDVLAVARIMGQVHKNLELTGELLGTLGIGTTNVTNILIQPAYVELRIALIQALKPYDEVRAVVAQALHKLESKAAADIASDTTRELAQ